MSPLQITSYLLAMLTIPSIFALPYHHQRSRKSCGKELNNRIFYICSKYGGFATLDDSTSAAHRRQKRGIVDECCKRPCIDWDLRQYCNQNFVTDDMSSEDTEDRTVEQQHLRNEPNLNMYFFKALQQQHQQSTTTKRIEFGTVAPEFQKAAFINKF